MRALCIFATAAVMGLPAVSAAPIHGWTSSPPNGASGDAQMNWDGCHGSSGKALVARGICHSKPNVSHDGPESPDTMHYGQRGALQRSHTLSDFHADTLRQQNHSPSPSFNVYLDETRPSSPHNNFHPSPERIEEPFDLANYLHRSGSVSGDEHHLSSAEESITAEQGLVLVWPQDGSKMPQVYKRPPSPRPSLKELGPALSAQASRRNEFSSLRFAASDEEKAGSEEETPYDKNLEVVAETLLPRFSPRY